MEDQKTLILDALIGLERPITIKDIAKKISLDRHAVARNLDTLELLGKVRKIHIGSAKKYILTSNIPVSSLIDISSDLILILDSTRIVQYINNSAIQFLSLSGSALLGERLDTLNIPLFSHRDIIKELKQYSFKGVHKQKIQYLNEQWFEISILGFSINAGTTLISLIATDISDQIRIEESLIQSENNLRISEEKYRILADNSIDVIWTLDPYSEKFTFLSPAVELARGYTADEAMQLTLRETVTKESYDEIKSLMPQRISAFLHCKGPYPGDRLRVNQLHKNGSVIPCEVVSTFITDTEGNVTAILGISRDISQKEQMEREIWKSEEKFKLLAENIGDIVWIVNTDTDRFEYVNPAVIQLGYYPNEVQGHLWSEFMKPDEYKKISQYLKQRISDYGSENPVNQGLRQEITMYHKNGSPILVETVSTFITSEGTRVTHLIGVSRDMSKFKQKEQNLATSYQSLYKEHQKIQHLSRTSHHNVPDKLHAIRLFTQQAIDKNESDRELKEILSQVIDSVSYLENLMSNTRM